MDNCGDTGLPLIPEVDELPGEQQKKLLERLQKHTIHWEYQKRPTPSWVLTGVTEQFFDTIYSPYTYVMDEDFDDLYEDKYHAAYIQIIDQSFKTLVTKNVECVLRDTRETVLLLVTVNREGKILIDCSYGIGQFLPSPVVNEDYVLYSKNFCKVTSCTMQQSTLERYEGSYLSWNTLDKLRNYAKKCAKKEWLIHEVNSLLPNNAMCVSTLDVLNRLLYVVDFCSNLDFYLWMGPIVESWQTWPERGCEPLTYAHLRQAEAFFEKTGDLLSFTDIVLKNNLQDTSLMDNIFKRKNLYLGCPKEIIHEAMPFYTSVANGVFTLSDELLGE